MGNMEETPGDGTQLSSAAMPGQESFFNPESVLYQKEDKLRAMIRDLDVSRLTPIEAMNILYELNSMVKGEDDGQD
jgi:DNA mismatch repair protein MutS